MTTAVLRSSAQTEPRCSSCAPGSPSTASEEQMRLQPSSYSQPRRGCICWSATPRHLRGEGGEARGLVPRLLREPHLRSCACGSTPSML